MIGDYGIYSQIFGFILIFLYVKETKLSQFSDGYTSKCMLEDGKMKVFNKTRKIKVFNKNIDFNSQFFLGGVIANIIGLTLQLSEINNWFFNNFPEF